MTLAQGHRARWWHTGVEPDYISRGSLHPPPPPSAAHDPSLPPHFQHLQAVVFHVHEGTGQAAATCSLS